MKKKKRGALHAKHRASTHPRDSRARREDFAALRAEAMDSVLTPAEHAVWEKVHHRHD